MKKSWLIPLIAAIGIAINWLSLLIGWWPITLLIGLVSGLLLPKKGMSFLIVCCVGCLSWGLPLLLLAINAPVGQVALAVESIIGISALHGIAIVLTIILGGLLSIAGWWVGIAYRGLAIALGFPHPKQVFLGK